MRLEYFLFGCREYSLDSPRELINLALSSSRTATLTPRGTVVLSIPTAKGLREQINALGAREVAKPRGIGGLIISLSRHIPTVGAVVISLFLCIFSSDLVFDVQISGNGRVSEEQIIAELDAAGFGVGSRWSKTDESAVELSVLQASDTLSWISINRRGRTAYVSVLELDSVPVAPPAFTAANIVASCDCVIEEITVLRGSAAVSVGDTVREGELLISGIVEGEGGTEYVMAEGIVRGTSSERITTEISRRSVEAVTREGTLAALSVKIFNFNINIFQSYGNLPEGCAIIEEKSNITLLGRRLPVTVVRGKYAYSEQSVRTLSDSELPIAAGNAHTERLNSALLGRDLISLKTEGEFTDGGYKMQSLAVYSAQVGRVVEIKTED